jgi:hypothetical protein
MDCLGDGSVYQIFYFCSRKTWGHLSQLLGVYFFTTFDLI